MTPFQMEILPLDLVYVWSSVCGNEDRLDDAIHLTLVMAWAGRIKWTSVVFIFIFIFIFMCVCSVFALRQVSDLVLVDPIPEDVFEDDQWKEYW